jgi:hypothetical protein
MRADGSSRRSVTAPGRGLSDETPRWSRDGRWVLFVRSGPTTPNASASGRLYLVRRSGRLVGPIARLGPVANYYGHYGWPDTTDWYQPPVR